MSKKKITFEGEIYRKLIHLSAIIIPTFYYFSTKELTIVLLFILSCTTISIDILSKPKMPLHEFVSKYLGFMIRKHEKSKKWWRLNGASWLCISALFVFLVFPKFIAVSSFYVLIFADLTAALVGRRFGKIKLRAYKKTLEGSISFLIVTVLVTFFMGYFHNAINYFYVIGILVSIGTTFAELISKKIKIDDNLAVPVVYSMLMVLLNLFSSKSFLPLI